MKELTMSGVVSALQNGSLEQFVPTSRPQLMTLLELLALNFMSFTVEFKEQNLCVVYLQD